MGSVSARARVLGLLWAILSSRAQAQEAEAPAAEGAALSQPAGELGANSGEIKRAFAALEQRLGRARYSEALAAVGVTDPLKLGGLERIRTFYRELSALAEVA